MSQLERQYDELEEVGRDIENALRECEDGKLVFTFTGLLKDAFITCSCQWGQLDEVLDWSCEWEKRIGQKDCRTKPEVSEHYLMWLRNACYVYVLFDHRMKELELEDRQYEVDKELAELSQVSRKCSDCEIN